MTANTEVQDLLQCETDLGCSIGRRTHRQTTNLEYQRRYRAEHKEQYRSYYLKFYRINSVRIKARRKIYKHQNPKRRFVERYIRLCGCAVCGRRDGPILCYDLHHMERTTKAFSMSAINTSRHSLEEVIAEMRKCVVLCAFCHRLVEWGGVTIPRERLPKRFRRDL